MSLPLTHRSPEPTKLVPHPSLSPVLPAPMCLLFPNCYTPGSWPPSPIEINQRPDNRNKSNFLIKRNWGQEKKGVLGRGATVCRGFGVGKILQVLKAWKAGGDSKDVKKQRAWSEIVKVETSQGLRSNSEMQGEVPREFWGSKSTVLLGRFLQIFFPARLEDTLKDQGKRVVSRTPLPMKINLATQISAPRLGRWLLRYPEGELYDLRALGMFAAAKPRCPMECLFHF